MSQKRKSRKHRRRHNYYECAEHAHQVRGRVVLSFASHLHSSFDWPPFYLFTYTTLADTLSLCKKLHPAERISD
jgi:hypothetical protein